MFRLTTIDLLFFIFFVNNTYVRNIKRYFHRTKITSHNWLTEVVTFALSVIFFGYVLFVLYPMLDVTRSSSFSREVVNNAPPSYLLSVRFLGSCTPFLSFFRTAPLPAPFPLKLLSVQLRSANSRRAPCENTSRSAWRFRLSLGAVKGRERGYRCTRC